MKKRTAKDFSRREISLIASAYSTGNYTYHNFIKEYGSTQLTFYAIIDSAITKCIVPDRIVEAIEKIGSTNSFNKVRELSSDEEVASMAASRCTKANRNRRARRNTYVFPKSEAISLVSKYLASPLPKLEFCKENYMTDRVFDRTLKKAIMEGWVTLSDVESLRKKAYQFNEKGLVDKVFNAMIARRNQYKMGK